MQPSERIALPRRPMCRLGNLLDRPQTPIPLLGQLTHPTSGFVKGVRANDKVVLPTLTPTRHEAYSVKDGQVLGHCLTTYREVLGQGRRRCFTAHGQQLEQIAAGRIGEGRQDLGDAHDEVTNGWSSLPMTYSANFAITPVQPLE